MDRVHVEDDTVTRLALDTQSVSKGPFGRQAQVRWRIHVLEVPKAV